MSSMGDPPAAPDDGGTAATATGGCLCGRVRWRTTAPLEAVTACHCSQCRKQSSHFMAFSATKTASIKIEGEENITWFRASEDARRGFCATCGSHLFWHGNDSPRISIAAASIDVPFPFELAFACKVPNAAEVEKALHTAFSPQRLNPKREFFSIDPDQAIAILKLLHVADATQEIAEMPSTITNSEVVAGEQYRSRRPNLNFGEMGIPIGAELLFSDGESTVTVANNRKVSYEGDEFSLSALTRSWLELEYYVSPGRHWTYNGRSLDKIYEETYELI